MIQLPLTAKRRVFGREIWSRSGDRVDTERSGATHGPGSRAAFRVRCRFRRDALREQSPTGGAGQS